jgi:hypothetical protein
MNDLPAERPVLDAQVVERPAGTRPGPLGQLGASLAAARDRCKAAEKDAVNPHYKYRFASSESVITEAKVALFDSGISLLQAEQVLNGYEREGENRFELVRKFVVLHSSGEWFPITVVWPVVLERGRPLDKAVAIASTSSLAYLLRDLLMMPRVDPQDEEAAGPAEPKQLVGDEALGRINDLMVALGVTEAQLKKALGGYGVDNAHQLSTEQAADMEARLRKNLDARKAKEAATAKPETNSTATTNA